MGTPAEGSTHQQRQIHTKWPDFRKNSTPPTTSPRSSALRRERRFLARSAPSVCGPMKENKLQDPENKQWFTPDETMAPIFGTEKIKCFSMAKYLKEHLTNPGK